MARIPKSVSDRQLKDRTLTNLYNALNVFRGRDSMKTKEAARDFAPRLDQLHRELDQAVCDAYGWDYAVLALNDEEEILRRLLALNLERAAQSDCSSGGGVSNVSPGDRRWQTECRGLLESCCDFLESCRGFRARHPLPVSAGLRLARAATDSRRRYRAFPSASCKFHRTCPTMRSASCAVFRYLVRFV